MDYSFIEWEKRRKLAPEADRVLPLIAAAGTTGMTRAQIGHAVKLDREVLDEMLNALVQIGLLKQFWRDGLPVFQAV